MKEKIQHCEKKYQDILAQDNRLKLEEEELQREKEENQNAVIQTIGGLMDYIRKPYNIQLDFDTRLKTLVNNMQALKLPKNTAQEFFKELANSKECICGRCIGEKEKKCILAKADEYLGADSLVVVNSIKRALNEYKREEQGEELERRLKAGLEKETVIDQSMDRLALRMAESGNEEALQVREEVKKLEQEISEEERKLKRLTTNDYVTNTGLNSENNIPKAKEAWEEARDNYLRASGTYQFTMKAEQMKEKLSRLKGKTGIQNWNILCRWALCCSLREKSIPLDLPQGEESNVEISWFTFGGENYKVYEALIKARCIRDGLGTDEATLAKYFYLHLSRGIAYLSSTNYIKSLEDLLRLTQKDKEEDHGSVSGL